MTGMSRAIMLVLMGCGLCWQAGCGYRWQAQSLGAGGGPAAVNWHKPVLRVTGSGAGLDPKGADAARFVFVPMPPDDFEIVACLRSLDGGNNASAGLLARESGRAGQA